MLLMSVFGARVAVIYVVLGLVIAVIGGTIIEKLHMEQEVEGFIRSAERVDLEIPEQTCRERAAYAGGQMLSTFCKKSFPIFWWESDWGRSSTTGSRKAGSRRCWG